jgi:hypothetical protein
VKALLRAGVLAFRRDFEQACLRAGAIACICPCVHAWFRTGVLECRGAFVEKY